MSSETALNGSIRDLSKINKLIHEPARLMIFALLSTLESADFLFLMRQTALTQGNLSSHIKKLENAGYITVKKEFTGKRPHTILALTNSGRTEFLGYQKQIQEFLNSL